MNLPRESGGCCPSYCACSPSCTATSFILPVGAIPACPTCTRDASIDVEENPAFSLRGNQVVLPYQRP